MKLDSTKYNNMVSNAASNVKISSTIYKAFIADVKTVIDGNDDLYIAHAAGTKVGNVHGLAFRGALVYLTANESIANATNQAVNWDAETYDTSSIWDISNPSRLTVPTGVTKVHLRANVSWAINATGIRKLNITKNGGNYQGQVLVIQQAVTTASTTTDQIALSPVLNVVAGDYFELLALQTSGGALNIGYIANGLTNWFAMEVVQ